MTKAEVILFFEVSCIEDEKLARFDNSLREKLFKCSEEEYSGLCETMEEMGYYGLRLYPFCARGEDSEGLRKALLWISDNSGFVKGILDEYGTSIQLSIKFLVGDSWEESLGYIEGCPLELNLSADDLELLKEHKIDLNVTAESCDSFDD